MTAPATRSKTKSSARSWRTARVFFRIRLDLDSKKSLFRRVEKAIEAIEKSSDVASTIASTAGAVIENFQEDLGVRGGRLYEKRDDHYELTKTFGDVKPISPGVVVSAQYPPVVLLLEGGVVVLDSNS